MVLGDRTTLDSETAEAFRIAGTYHVLAISGAQVALIAGVAAWCLRRVGLGVVALATIVSALTVFYAELVGGEVPVVRAATMASVLLLGRCWDLDSDPANLLGLAAGLLLLCHPSAVMDVGFQLSFSATLGIVMLTPALLRVLPRLPWRLEVAIGASLAAQAALLPLLVIHFHRLAPAAVLLNLAAVPLATAVLLAGLTLLAAAALAPPAVSAVAGLTYGFAHGLLRSGEVVRWFPWLDPRLPDPPYWGMALWLAGLGAVVLGRRRAPCLLIVGFVGIVWGRSAQPGDGRLQLTVLDVGHGDSLLLRSPKGNVWLVDAGGTYQGGFDVGESVVAPVLWSQGVRRLEVLALSHAHRDHAGGAAFVLGAFGVEQMWEGPAPFEDPVYRRVASAAVAGGVTRLAVARGVAREWDGVSVEVLGPPPPPRAPRAVRNDDSVVLRLRYGAVDLLLTGDIEGPAEAALGGVCPVVLKVPHHGSRHSSKALIDGCRAKPLRVAIVSVGANGLFGHPHPEVLARYRSGGFQIYRTDRDGAVTVATDGERVWARTYRQGRERLVFRVTRRPWAR
jgi:competence protein ComEC